MFPNYVKLAKKNQCGQLITISISHFNEMARWCLQRGQIHYTEHSYAPIAHILPSLQAHMGKGILEKVKTSKVSPTNTPVFVLPDGRILCDSWSICSYASDHSQVHLKPIDSEESKKLLDTKVGVCARIIAYYHILKWANHKECDSMFLENSHWMWNIFWRLGGKYAVRATMIKLYGEKEKYALMRRQLDEVVEAHFDPIVRNRKTKYLSGNEIGVLDIAVASLFAPIVNPPLYCEGRYFKWLDQMERNDKDMAKEINYWRSKEVGKYVLELYSHHRLNQD